MMSIYLVETIWWLLLRMMRMEMWKKKEEEEGEKEARKAVVGGCRHTDQPRELLNILVKTRGIFTGSTFTRASQQAGWPNIYITLSYTIFRSLSTSLS